MKLHYSPGACSMACHITLIESGLKFNLAKANFKELSKINPKGYVPVLETDSGEIITEGAVIMQYIGDQAPEKKLIPKAGTMERYRAQEWLNYVASEMHKGIGILFNEELPSETKKLLTELLDSKFEFLDNHFAKNNFLMGAQYSVADAYLFTILNWTNFLKIEISSRKNILSFMERVKSRPATAEALKAEGL